MRYVPENERDSDNSLWDLPDQNGHIHGEDNIDDPTNSSGLSPDSSDDQVQNGAGMVRPRRPTSPQPPYNQPYLFNNEFPQAVNNGYEEIPGINFIARNPVYGPDPRPVANPYHLTNGHVRDDPPLRILSVDESLIWPSHHTNHVPNIAVNVPTRRTHRRLFRRGANPSWFGTSAFSQANVSANRRSRQVRTRSPSRIPVLLENLPSSSSDLGPVSNFSYVDYLESLPSYSEYQSTISNPEVARFIRPPTLFIETTAERLEREVVSESIEGPTPGTLSSGNQTTAAPGNQNGHPVVLGTLNQNGHPAAPGTLNQNGHSAVLGTLNQNGHPAASAILNQNGHPVASAILNQDGHPAAAIILNDQFPEQFQLQYEEVQIQPATPPPTPVNYSLQRMMENQPTYPQTIDQQLQQENSRDILSPSIFSTIQTQPPDSPSQALSSLNDISDLNSSRSTSFVSSTSGMSRLSRNSISNTESVQSNTIDEISSSDNSLDSSLLSTPRLITPEMAEVVKEEVAFGSDEDNEDIVEKLDAELADCMHRLFVHRNSLNNEELPGPSGVPSTPSTSTAVMLYEGAPTPEETIIPLQAELVINGQTVAGSGKCSLSFNSLSAEDFTNLIRQDMEINIKLDHETGNPCITFSVKPELQNPPENTLTPIYRPISRYLCGEILTGHTKRVNFPKILTTEHVFERDVTFHSSSEEAECQDVECSDDSDSEIPDIEDFEFS